MRFFFFPGLGFYPCLFHSLCISSLSFSSHHSFACLTMDMVFHVVQWKADGGGSTSTARERQWWHKVTVQLVVFPQYRQYTSSSISFFQDQNAPLCGHTHVQTKQKAFLALKFNWALSCNLILPAFVIFTNSPYKIMKKMGVLYINY